jgi:hypothetical protein
MLVIMMFCLERIIVSFKSLVGTPYFLQNVLSLFIYKLHRNEREKMPHNHFHRRTILSMSIKWNW